MVFGRLFDCLLRMIQFFSETSPPGRKHCAFFLRWSCQCLLLRVLHHCQRTTWYNWNISLMKQQFVANHIIRQTEIPALQDGWVTNTPSVYILCPQNIACPYVSVKNITCLSGGQSSIGQVSSVSCKIEYRSVSINCCFASDIVLIRLCETTTSIYRSCTLCGESDLYQATSELSSS